MTTLRRKSRHRKSSIYQGVVSWLKQTPYHWKIRPPPRKKDKESAPGGGIVSIVTDADLRQQKNQAELSLVGTKK